MELQNLSLIQVALVNVRRKTFWRYLPTLKRVRWVFTNASCSQLKKVVRSELNIPLRFSYLECTFAKAIVSSLAFAVKSSFIDLKDIITGVFFAVANFADEFSISIDSAANVVPRINTNSPTKIKHRKSILLFLRTKQGLLSSLWNVVLFYNSNFTVDKCPESAEIKQISPQLYAWSPQQEHSDEPKTVRFPDALLNSSTF